MTHYGDICALSGTGLEPVDCVIGGSPCQDLSIAGKRAGLKGKRSSLFLEQIRVIKELREEDIKRGTPAELIRPRYAIWENVPGALSSGEPKGEDFRCVLEEFARVADPAADVPRPPEGTWRSAGSVVGDGWSLAWRVMDAQFFGVPNAAVESRLSAILQANVPMKYYLSVKACQGILRRAEKRGKKLPEILERALLWQIGWMEKLAA